MRGQTISLTLKNKLTDKEFTEMATAKTEVIFHRGFEMSVDKQWRLLLSNLHSLTISRAQIYTSEHIWQSLRQTNDSKFFSVFPTIAGNSKEKFCRLLIYLSYAQVIISKHDDVRGF
jgi:hypothetical protein